MCYPTPNLTFTKSFPYLKRASSISKPPPKPTSPTASLSTTLISSPTPSLHGKTPTPTPTPALFTAANRRSSAADLLGAAGELKAAPVEARVPVLVMPAPQRSASRASRLTLRRKATRKTPAGTRSLAVHPEVAKDMTEDDWATLLVEHFG